MTAIPTPEAASVPTASAPVSTATAIPTPEAASVPTPAPSAYDSTGAMNDMSLGRTYSAARFREALRRIDERHDTSMAPVLVEVIRFVPDRGVRDSIGETLRSLTGQALGTLDWGEWMEWLGKNLDAFQPPPGYAEWKAKLYSNIDPRFAMFIRPAGEFSRIDLTEVVWGGVIPDGIPDLRDPDFLQPQDADYMNTDDRVFGVRINGETRAYPLRIVNAHEMVNDWVGGEPISLMW